MNSKVCSPILITGCPRSGKTLIAQILKISGVFFGDVDKMMENPEFIRQFQLLADINKGGAYIPQNFKDAVKFIIRTQGYKEGHWAIKHSDITLFWPVFHYAFPNAKVIIVRRDISDIIHSCMHTSYMLQCSSPEGWANLLGQYDDKIKDMILLGGMNCKTIWPNRMANGDYSQVYELLEWLGLPWRSQILTKIDPKFWKQRKNK